MPFNRNTNDWEIESANEMFMGHLKHKLEAARNDYLEWKFKKNVVSFGDITL